MTCGHRATVSRSSSRSVAEVMAPTRVPTMPTGRRGSQCRPKIWSTPPSRAPEAITSSAPPGMTSSAGWKISRMRPGSSGAEARARAVASRIVVWASCPQAWQAPSTVDEWGRPVASVSGRASMSARSATHRSPVPMSQIRPVPVAMISGLRPAALSRPATSSVVPNSWRDSSGWACRCRNQASTSAALAVSHSSSQSGPRPAPRSGTVGILTPLSVNSTSEPPPGSLGASGRESRTVTRVLLALLWSASATNSPSRPRRRRRLISTSSRREPHQRLPVKGNRARVNQPHSLGAIQHHGPVVTVTAAGSC